MTKSIDLAFSPCPNDTFVFHALMNGLVDTRGYDIVPHIDDVETLNGAAFNRQYTASKLSFHAYLLLKKHYRLLHSGAALGFGCGPLLVSRGELPPLERARIAIPGAHTTAYLLLKLWNPRIGEPVITRFDNIMEGVASGKFDAGLIIHEGRFVYPRYGLRRVVDLGRWWESETGMPIPLGCIALRNGDDEKMWGDINSMIRRSVEYALTNPAASKDYVRSYAQEMEDDVIRQHIELYVNDFTVDLGDTGRRAIETLEEMARCRGILEPGS